MRSLKTILTILALIFIGVLCGLIYWNNHLYHRTEKIEESEKKIEVLERAIDFYPSNDLVFYELGRAYFDLGVNHIYDSARSGEYLQKSIRYFRKSLRSNPSSYFGHFYMAQSFLYLGYIFPSSAPDSFDEFKKAASLAGENSQIYFEVSKIFLSQWTKLSLEDKGFALEILKKVMSRKDKERTISLLHVWEMNVKDYTIIENILPEDQRIYRMYGDFLAEKSLSLEARLRSLAKAEYLDFQRAKEEYKQGEQEFFSYRMEKAFQHFRNCLNILARTRFYQNSASQTIIDLYEFNELKKLALLSLIKSQIEQGKGFTEVEDYLSDYFSLEDKAEAFREIEIYLRERGLIRENLEASFNDLDRLFFQLILCFHQNRFREIMNVGRQLKQSFVIIPENKKKVYVLILNIIGDSYQKINYLYDAGDFYQKALEIDPNNLENLIKIRRNYERIGTDEEIDKIRERIEGILSPKEKMFNNLTIKKSRGFSSSLILDGRDTHMDLHFDHDETGITPLISVFFNDHVVWEDYLNEDILSLSLNTKIGKNSLRIVPLNRDIYLVKLAYH